MNLMHETAACIVCRNPSHGHIASGHVRRGKEEVLATFCSGRCEKRAPAANVDGCYGPWRRWMGYLLELTMSDWQPIDRALHPSIAYVAKVSLDRDEVRKFARHARVAGAKVKTIKALVSFAGHSALIHAAVIIEER